MGTVWWCATNTSLACCAGTGGAYVTVWETTEVLNWLEGFAYVIFWNWLWTLESRACTVAEELVCEIKDEAIWFIDCSVCIHFDKLFTFEITVHGIVSVLTNHNSIFVFTVVTCQVCSRTPILAEMANQTCLIFVVRRWCWWIASQHQSHPIVTFKTIQHHVNILLAQQVLCVKQLPKELGPTLSIGSNVAKSPSV